MEPVTITSAKLGRGWMSTVPSPPSQPAFGDRSELRDLLGSLNQTLAQRPSSGDIFEEREGEGRVMNEESAVVERPMWQVFITFLQIHFPDMGREIAPALDIGEHPPRRVTLSTEALDFLNRFIQLWYEGGVELTVVTVDDPNDPQLGPLQEVLYCVPYRPVTGLNLVVVPTIQQTLDPVERLVLNEKARFSQDRGLQGVMRFLRVCVYENLVPLKSPKRTAPKRVRKRGLPAMSFLEYFART